MNFYVKCYITKLIILYIAIILANIILFIYYVICIQSVVEVVVFMFLGARLITYLHAYQLLCQCLLYMVILFTDIYCLLYMVILLLFTVHGDTVYCYCLLYMVILFTVYGDTVYCTW